MRHATWSHCRFVGPLGVLIFRHFTEGHRQGFGLALAQDSILTELAGAVMAMLRQDRASFMASVYRRDDVSGPRYPPLPGPPACGSSTIAPSALLHAEAFGNTRCNRLNLHANPAAGDVTFILELGSPACRARRNIEADTDRTAGRRIDRRVDADDVAVHVEGWPAGIALVDRGVIWTILSRALRRCRGLRAETMPAVMMPPRPNGLPTATTQSPIRGGARQIHMGKSVLPSTLIRARSVFGSVPTTLAAYFSAVIGRDLDGLGMVDHVVVGHRIAVRRDKEARAFAGDHSMAPWHAFGMSLESELAKELVERRLRPEWEGVAVLPLVQCSLHVFLRRFPDFDTDRNDGGLDLRDEIGEPSRVFASLSAARALEVHAGK